jgi:altronate dehydratase
VAKELSGGLTIASPMALSDNGDALRLKDDDNVAVALRALSAPSTLAFGPLRVAVHTDIPAGHKIALCAIARGELIRKYGQPIGKSSAAIAAGEHVHVHNVEGMRGRGDLAEARA